MAKSNGFTSRFPNFGIFFVIAIALAIPLTTWSLNNVSTNTQQHAQTATCTARGGTCYKYNCPTSGYLLTSGTCGLMTDSACCLPKITSAPSGLTNISYTCKLYSGDPPSGGASVKVKWNSVSHANQYIVYWQIQNSSGGVVGSDNKTVSGLSTTISASVLIPGKFFWYVKGYNSLSKLYGPVSSKKEFNMVCK